MTLGLFVSNLPGYQQPGVIYHQKYSVNVRVK